jgi:hypothetical protein
MVTWWEALFGVLLVAIGKSNLPNVEIFGIFGLTGGRGELRTPVS